MTRLLDMDEPRRLEERLFSSLQVLFDRAPLRLVEISADIASQTATILADVAALHSDPAARDEARERLERMRREADVLIGELQALDRLTGLGNGTAGA